MAMTKKPYDNILHLLVMVFCICSISISAGSNIEKSSLQGWQALYDYTNGTNWSFCNQMRERPCGCVEHVNSDTSKPNKLVVCSYTNGEYRIKQIILRSNNLSGTIPIHALQNMQYLNFIDLSYQEGFGDLRAPMEYKLPGYDRGCVDWVTCVDKFEFCSFTPVKICPGYKEESTYRPTTSTSAPTQQSPAPSPSSHISGFVIFVIVVIILFILLAAYKLCRHLRKDKQRKATREDRNNNEDLDNRVDISHKSKISIVDDNQPVSRLNSVSNREYNKDATLKHHRFSNGDATECKSQTEQDNLELSAIQELLEAEKANDKTAIEKAQRMILGEKNHNEIVIQ